MDSVVPPDSQERAATEGATKLVRTYRAWEGSNKFCLGGRFIFGPDVRTIFRTTLFIVVPVALFCVFVANKLRNHFSGNSGIAIMAVCIAWTLYVLVLLLLTSGRDPGIIPRSANPPEIESNESSHELWQGMTPHIPRTRDVIINGIIVKVKYCNTCKHYRPPRCSHCSICDNCVERFDHHCPWLGQCIGLRNYRCFFMFIFTTTLLCIYVHGFCWVYITMVMNREKTTIWKAMIKTPASVLSMFVIICSFAGFLFVGGLSIFHIYLIGTNQSTYESFRYKYSMRDNPYNKGIIRNFMEVFFRSIPPSKNKFRAKVEKRVVTMTTPNVSQVFSSRRPPSEKWEQEKPIWGEHGDRSVAIESQLTTRVNSIESQQ